jgi:hypothetical protein
MMASDYNDFAEPQKAAIEKQLCILFFLYCFPIFSSQNLTSSTLLSHKNTLVVADYGCAGGKNSVLFLECLLKMLV